MRRWVFFLIPVWLISTGSYFTGTAAAGPVLRVEPHVDSYDLAAHVSYMEDADGALTIEQILALENSRQWRMNLKPKAPSIPLNEVMSWEDWLKGRRARRETGNRVAPEIIRRPSSSSDKRLRRLFHGERGLPFTPTEKL